MFYLCKRDHPVWLESLLPGDIYSKSTIELLCIDGCGVAVPADPLLATSPLLRTIFSGHLPPVLSPPVLTMPAVTAEVLKIVGELLTSGTSSCLGKERVEEVNQVFKMLGIEALLDFSQMTVDDEAVTLVRKVKVEEANKELEVSENVQTTSQVKVEDDTLTEAKTLEEKVSVNDGDNEEEGIVDSPLKFLNLDMYEADSADQLVCPDILCAKTFKRRRLLENHIKRVHVGDRNFLCDFCPKRFHSKREKDSHVEYVHNAERIFDCPECFKKFKSRGDTLKHIKAIHLKLKAFVCKFCDRRFSQNSNMHSHIKRQHSKE